MNWGTVPDVCKHKSLEQRGFWSKGKVSMSPLNNFINLKKNAIFVTCERGYTIRFSKQSKNTVKVTLKNFSFPTFPNPNFKPIFSLRSSARDASL